MRLTGEQVVLAYRRVCAIRRFDQRAREAFAAEQILSLMHPAARMRGGYGHSIEEGGES